MQTGNRTIRLAYRAAGILLSGLLLALPAGPALLHAAGHNGSPAFSPAFSLDARGVPLGEVLKKITADTGYRITVDSEWAGWPVSGSFKNLPVNLGLRRILSNLNHSIVFDEAEHRIAIVIKSSPDDAAFPTASASRVVSALSPGESIPGAVPSKDSARLQDRRLVPPEEPGEAARTSPPAQEFQTRRAGADPDDDDVMPPGGQASKAAPAREIKPQKSVRPAGAVKNSELVPPDE